MVLDDYMRLKKLFAQRMVHKATASQGDRSSVSEVEGCAWLWGQLAVPSGMQCVFLAPQALGTVTQCCPHSLLGQNKPDIGFPLVPTAVISLVFQDAGSPQWLPVFPLISTQGLLPWSL